MTNKQSWMGEVDLEPGDLIEIFRTAYKHWAVYVGMDYVIHLAPPSEFAGAGVNSSKSILANQAMVKKELLSEVVGTDRYQVSNKHDSRYTVRPPNQIISLAEKMLGRMVEYEISSKNCEHFCNLLRYDVARSDQVRDFVWLVGALGALSLFGLSAILKN